jgi:hypothetical protein
MARHLARREQQADTRAENSRRSKFTPFEEAELRRAIENAWAVCRSAVAENDKSRLRELHLRAKVSDRSVNYPELERQFDRLRSYFPNPTRIEPSRIDPYVIPVQERTLEERLFKITRGYWSMPYSKGYGRRLRFLVMDRNHQALIGIIGLQSPSADLGCRDRFLGVSSERKLSVVNNTMDAYTVGATPAYAPLLGGKLVAGYLCSPVIRREYWKLYGNKVTTQLRKRIPQPLLAITTASAFGRSSIYNRLRNETRVLARPLGYTRGFGTLHLEAIYPRMVEWLKASDKHVPAGFGNGPKVRWQNIMHTLVGLSIPTKYLEHGLQREVFIVELVSNLLAVCQSRATPDPIAFDDAEWASYWLERWCLPRVSRQPNWHEFDASGMLRQALRAGHR